MTGSPPRLRHVDGEWLLVRDLRDEPALGARRLAQHHIAAHRTWGVSAGLRVEVRGGRLIVTPGFAVDRCGRTGILGGRSCEPLPRAADLPAHVVLRIVGDGPAACVRVRRRGEAARDTDVPLAWLDGEGAVHAGDGHRTWLRRPGPIRLVAGVVPRGAPVLAGSTPLCWTVHVDLADHRLDALPAIGAGVVGEPPSTALIAATADLPGGTFAQTLTTALTTTTVAADAVSADGFDLIVRHHAAAGTALPAVPGIRVTAGLRVAPVAVSWLALTPSPRPAVARRKALP